MKRTPSLLVALALTTTCASVACTADLQLGSGIIVTCDDDSVCPDGLTCVGTRCLDSEQIDTRGPAQVIPDDASVAVAGEVEFSWGSVPGASTYTLSISSESDFASPVGDTPLMLADTHVSVVLQAGTYYWRVTSDVTDPSVSNTRVFGLLDDTVYVACAPDIDCALAGVSLELGTERAPYQAIQRGVATAALYGMAEVHVATREAGAAYVESFAIADGVSILGGYDTTFSTRDGRSTVESATTTVNALSVYAATRLDGFVLRASDGAQQSTVLRLVDTGSNLTVANVRCETSSLKSPLVVVTASSDSEGSLISDCELASSDGAEAMLQISGRGALRVQNTTLQAASVATAGDLVGFDVDKSSLAVQDTTVTLDSASTSIAVRAAGRGDYTLGDTVTLSNVVATISGVAAYGLDAKADEVIDVTRSTIAVSGDGGTPLAFDTIHDLRVTSSVLVTRTGSPTALLATTTEGVLQNNTWDRGQLELRDATYLRFANNVFVGASYTGGSAIYLNGGEVLAMQANAFVAFGCSYFKGAMCYEGGDDAPSGMFTVNAAGNLVFATLEQAALSDALTPAEQTPLATSGIDPNAALCSPNVGSNVSSAQIVILNRMNVPICGGQTVDRDNKPLATPKPMGAYQP